jgi:DNA mismatch repair protein MutS2
MAADAERRGGRLVPTGDIGSARAHARASLETVGSRMRESIDGTAPAAAAHAADARPAEVGDRVAVGPLGLEGVVQSLHDGTADVDVRGKRLKARVEDLRVIAPAPTTAAPARVQVNVELQPRDGVTGELNLIGSTSDEAVTRVERFLDDVMIAELRSVRIIHGYGTGQLRRSVAEFLRAHPLVSSFGPAPDNQGGGGVTVVELKE